MAGKTRSPTALQQLWKWGGDERVSPVAWLFDELPVALEVAKIVTEAAIPIQRELKELSSCFSDSSCQEWSRGVGDSRGRG